MHAYMLHCHAVLDLSPLLCTVVTNVHHVLLRFVPRNDGDVGYIKHEYITSPSSHYLPGWIFSGINSKTYVHWYMFHVIKTNGKEIEKS
jgi:hypothetical protein